MDSITHLALGATLGEVMIGRRIGKKALVVGAAAQSLPDVDFLAAFWLSPSENLIAHRGFTHSFLFAGIVSLLLALLADRWHRRQSVFFGTWWMFFALQLSVHLLIDGCNAYGVGWLEPFTLQRVSFNLLFVADPFFFLGVGAASVLLVFFKSDHPYRFRLALIGLLVSLAYLLYAFTNKLRIEKIVAREIARNGYLADQHFTTPTPLNSWLWYAVVKDGEGFRIGYRSVFDQAPEIDWTYFPKNDSLLALVDDHEALQRLKRFSQGYYTISFQNDTLTFNDLRFGQITGWHNPRAPFVFHYYLQHPDDNNLVIQRGRFANWNSETTASLWSRIKGN
ncbi:MAG: metal-dependent hydrolase [Flammeovirgaceae bacterium]|nr:MAG: metal-dependent hydrolase [Flammeovirgaceae bacterium]